MIWPLLIASPPNGLPVISELVPPALVVAVIDAAAAIVAVPLLVSFERSPVISMGTAAPGASSWLTNLGQVGLRALWPMAPHLLHLRAVLATAEGSAGPSAGCEAEYTGLGADEDVVEVEVEGGEVRCGVAAVVAAGGTVIAGAADAAGSRKDDP